MKLILANNLLIVCNNIFVCWRKLIFNLLNFHIPRLISHRPELRWVQIQYRVSVVKFYWSPLLSSDLCDIWWGHRDPKYCLRTRSMIHTSALAEVNQALNVWSLDILVPFCRQSISFNNNDYFDYSTHHINIHFPISKSC